MKSIAVLNRSNSLMIRLCLLALVVIVLPALVMTARSMAVFEQEMTPEIDRKAMAIARDVGGQVERAVSLGIPLDQLEGIDDFFQPLMKANPELMYMAIANSAGRILFARGLSPERLQQDLGRLNLSGLGTNGQSSSLESGTDLALPILAGGEMVGRVHLGIAHDYIRGLLQDIVMDVAMGVLASLIIAFEILLFLVQFNVVGPIKLVGEISEKVQKGDFSVVAQSTSRDEVGRFVRLQSTVLRQLDELYRRLAAYLDEVKQAHFDQGVVEKVSEIEARIGFLFRFSATGRPQTMVERRATDIRLPLFLFVFAEEFSRAFLPLYITELSPRGLGDWVLVVVALPMAVFMASIALASPLGGRLTNRFGARRVFLVGLVPALLGHGMSIFAFSVFDLILWRLITGLGYAVVTIACQSYISGFAAQGKRAQGLGIYVGAVMSAGICGTVIGGLVVEHTGYRIALAVATLVALVSGILVWRLLAQIDPIDTAPAPPPPRRHMVRLFRNWRFSALMAFAAVPAKLALTGFLFFLVPLMLFRDGLGVSDIARLMVIYPVIHLLVGQLSTRLADRGFRAQLVAAGAICAGTGLMLPILPGSAPIMLSILTLGFAHGLSSSPQLSMIPDICWTECRTFGQTNVLAFVRLIERIGSTIGPILAAFLAIFLGFSGAAAAMGGVVLLAGLVFLWLSRRYGPGPHIEPDSDDEVAS